MSSEREEMHNMLDDMYAAFEGRAHGSSPMDDIKSGPYRDNMAPDDFYQQLDPGIRFAVRVLHAHLIETSQSCQGGFGHPYDHPSIDLIAGAEDAQGFAALAALTGYGLDVAELQIVWSIKHGAPYQKLWRIELVKAHPERADELPNFVHCYRAVSSTKESI